MQSISINVGAHGGKRLVDDEVSVSLLFLSVRVFSVAFQYSLCRFSFRAVFSVAFRYSLCLFSFSAAF